MSDFSTLIKEYFSFNALLGVKTNAPFSLSKKKAPSIQKQKITIETPKNLQDVKRQVLEFEGCSLKKFAQNTVFGEGVESPKFMIIGEAPGEEEDESGVPFCGRSGKLLEVALARFGISRSKNAFITNSVFWRPPGNRKPEKEELQACKPFLEQMILILKPQIILTLGAVAVENLCEVKDSMLLLRKKTLSSKIAEGVKILPLYHPSYLIRSPGKKKDLYQDILHYKKQGYFKN